MAAVVLITGPPGSGKTTLAGNLADRLNLPVLAKDRIKETLFDALDDARTDVLGRASFQLLMQLVGDFAGGSGAFVVENAFRTADGPALRQRLAGADVLHIHCDATHATLCARVHRRAVQGERHPSHADLANLSASEIFAAPQVCGDPLTVPTDDFGSVHYRAAVAEAVARAAELARRE